MAAVTIESIETIPLRIPFDHWAPPPLFAGRPRNGVEMMLVRITASNGVVGWGEGYGGHWSANIHAIETFIRPITLGQDAADPDLTDRLERALHNLGRAGSTVQALSGIDIALWDIRGKMAGVPVSTLLGGAKRTRIEAYASLLQYGGKLDDVRRNTQRALDRGFRHIKLHERTGEAAAAARDVTGPDIPIMVDTNCAWTPDKATDAVNAMAPSKPFWVEEPIWPPEDFESLAALRGATGVPLAMGENATGVLDFRKDGGCARGRLRAAQRGQDRRPDQSLAHRDGSGDERRHLRAAQLLHRSGFPRHPPRHRRQETRLHYRAVLRRSRRHALCEDRAGR
jgi:L-alanine-DL-glutamate epimerase-like enolase superfamily enzyme